MLFCLNFEYWKGVRLGKWNFQGWVCRLKYVPGRYFEVSTSIPSPTRRSWSIKICVCFFFVFLVKPCKIDLLLK
jgi:hypothetical protein